MNNLDIAVVGAGIGGLAAALALARRGAKVTVYEQAKELAEVGAGLQIGANGVAVLQALGVNKAAGKLANVPDAIVLRDMFTSARVARLPVGAASVGRWGRPYWQFHRADLLAVLADGARAAGVTIKLGSNVDVLPEADLVVAADGVRSGIRAKVFDGQPAVFTKQAAWRGLIPAQALPKAIENAATVYMGQGKHLVTYPLRGGSQVNFVAVTEHAEWADEGWNIPDTPDNLRACFSDAAPEVQDILGAVEETFYWGFFSHPYLPNWSKDNVVMIGDACHPMLPYLAQGAVMALEDAWVLAHELDNASDLAGGLQVYERLRKPRATRVQKAASSNTSIYHMRRSPVRSFAYAGVAAVSMMSPSSLLKRYDWLFGHDVTSTR